MRPVTIRLNVQNVVGSIVTPCTKDEMRGTTGVLSETMTPQLVLIVSRFAGLAVVEWLPKFLMPPPDIR